MSLNATQKVTVAEITQETYATIDALVSSLITEQEATIIADIATWNTNRNDVDTELDIDGVMIKARWLLNDIRERTRKALGLPLYSEEAQPTSGALANQFVF